MDKIVKYISTIAIVLLYLLCGYVILMFVSWEKPTLNAYELSFVILVFGIMFVLSLILYFMDDNPSSVNISFFKLFGVAFDYKGRGQEVDKVTKKGEKGETEEVTYRIGK